MITLKLVKTLEELVELTPLFLEGYYAMNKKKKVFEMGPEGFIKTLIGILNTTPQNGIVVAYDGELAIGYGAAFDDTPMWADKKELLLWALYVNPAYKGYVVSALFEESARLAREQGYGVMKAFNARFTGGMYRLFEHKLGMRRHRIQFNYNL